MNQPDIFHDSPEKIAILDFGSQYAHLIAKQIRDLGVYSEILPHDVSAESLKDEYRGIVISGGPSSVYAEDAPELDEGIYDIGLPVLGICFGHQLTAHKLGGTVERGEKGEYGKSHFLVENSCALTEGVSEESVVWMSHFDSVTEVPEGFVITGKTGTSEIAAMHHESKPIFTVQFHPEVTHTEEGMKMLDNFLFSVCEVKKEWSLEKYLEVIKHQIVQQVGDRNVFVLLSGGVDSLVTFVLLNSILSEDRLFGLHIDTGFMRKGESAAIDAAVRKLGYDNISVVTSDKFLENLKGVVEPEEKRKIIGKTFLDVFDEEVEKLYLDSHMWLLGQGTIYPDTIESGGTKQSDTIKTHHNRVSEIEKLIAEGRVVEPLEKLYKDDVRKIGEMLDIPRELLYRHPFPGPGLAIMMLCSESDDSEMITLERDKQGVVEEHVTNKGLENVILPLKSVGVQGDERTYAHPMIVSGKADWNLLDEIGTEVPNSLSEVNRVVWLVSHDVMPEFSVVKHDLTAERVEMLQEVHAVVDGHSRKHGIYDDMWEMPIVLLPLTINGGETIVLRPLTSVNAMTVSFYRMEESILQEIVKDVMAIEGVDAVVYDVTNKPPGTVQWE